MSNLLVLYNPVCGDKSAHKIFNEQVLPLLKQHNKVPSRVVETTHAGHAGEVVIDFLLTTPGPLTIILGSGDGTLHEIVVSLYNATVSTPTEISIVLVPCGTANALYWSLFPPKKAELQSSLLQSLDTFLSPSLYNPRPLTFAITSFHSPTSTFPAEPDTAKTSVAIVVTSTSLHASILHDSEALRSTYPGIERFKIAAQKNITRWYTGSVKLFPSPGSEAVQIYDPKYQRFVPSTTRGELQLSGPYAYFLSTVNVDRLESAFRITPLHNLPSDGDGPFMDVVIVRPQRDITIKDEEESSRESFSGKMYQVLMGAYQDGAHPNMTYGEDGNIQSSEEGSSSVVEYFKCGKWEWTPVSRFGTVLSTEHSVPDPTGTRRRCGTLCLRGWRDSLHTTLG